MRFGATGRCRARFAAGVTWTCRTAKAEWAARWGHTTVVVSGAIYVLGGFGDGTRFGDVWVSTDGGARAGLGRGMGRWGTPGGYPKGY